MTGDYLKMSENVDGSGASRPGSPADAARIRAALDPCEDRRVGFVEVDVLAECGINNAGHFICTRVGTDVAGGWTDCVRVTARWRCSP